MDLNYDFDLVRHSCSNSPLMPVPNSIREGVTLPGVTGWLF
jgi:hypothetical protein